MEERNLELDDDGKIKLRKRSDALGDEQPSEGDASDDIILDIPDFKGFGEENEDGAVSDEELLRRRQEREEEEQRRKNRAKELFAEGEELFAQGDLDGAGEKFKAGDIVRCTDWEDDRRGDMFVVYKTPQPAEEGDIWQNHYTVLGVGLYGRRPVVSEEQFHEADIALCSSEDLTHEPYGEQLAALQKAVTGKVVLPEDIWNRILHGRIIFNTCPSWRDIPELFDKSAGKS